MNFGNTIEPWHDRESGIFQQVIMSFLFPPLFVDLARLRSELAATQRKAFAEGTFRNLITQCKAYIYFAHYYSLPAFPATLAQLALFAQFLSRTFKTVSAIQNCVSGVRPAHILLGLTPPDLTHPTLKLYVRGLQRLKPGIVNRAHPLTPQMLSHMANRVDPGNPRQWATWTAMLIGFFTFARRSNLVPRSSVSFDPAKQLQRADIITSPSKLAVIFKWSKTIQHMQRILVIPVVALPKCSFCPVAAYQHLITLVPAKPSDPAFCVRKTRESSKSNVQAISQSNLQEMIKFLAADIGLDPVNYSSHSLRRGGASWAYRAGCSSEQIKLQGDWKSDCFSIYIDSSFEDRTVVSQKMARAILQDELPGPR